MLVLGIESSCDEMAVAIVRDGVEILSHVVSSQIALHQNYQGVFPEMAAREHVDLVLPTLKQALADASLTLESIDRIAVTNGPGLLGSLLVGLNSAKSLALALNKPLVGVNHVEAHLYAAMMDRSTTHRFPALGLVLSGGHTLLAKIHGTADYEWIGTTVDDAIGEAFDKTASLLGLPYPGGPAIEQLAKEGNPSVFSFKPCRVKESPWNFSFSGLKTQVLYALKGQNGSKSALSLLSPSEKADLAAAFQETALRTILDKAKKAVGEFPAGALYIGGGVSNNQRLRCLFEEANLGIPIFWPSKGLSLDNAAMIAGLGFWLTPEEEPLRLGAFPHL